MHALKLEPIALQSRQKSPFSVRLMTILCARKSQIVLSLIYGDINLIFWQQKIVFASCLATFFLDIEPNDFYIISDVYINMDFL